MLAMIAGLGLLFAVLGGVVFGLGRSSARAQQPAGRVVVQGRIIDWEPLKFRDSEAIHLPVVDYPLPDGSLNRFTNRTSLVGLEGIGDPVEVLVDPQNPRDAQLAGTAETRKVLGSVMMVIGGMVGVAGIVIAIGIAAVWVLFNR